MSTHTVSGALDDQEALKMLTTSFYRNNVAQRSKEIQREAAKTAEGLERLLGLASEGENIQSKKSVEAIDHAIEKLGVLRSRTVQLGELRQVIQDLENVARDKKIEGQKRMEEIVHQVGETRIQMDALSHERDVLSAQIMAANALCNVEEERVFVPQADDESSESSHYSHGGTTPGDRTIISDYCKGDWDDKVTDDFPDK